MSPYIPTTCKALVEEVRVDAATCSHSNSGLTTTMPLQGKEIVLKEVPIPELGENEVLIKVKAIGLNPGDLRGQFVPMYLLLRKAITGRLSPSSPTDVPSRRCNRRIRFIRRGRQARSKPPKGYQDRRRGGRVRHRKYVPTLGPKIDVYGDPQMSRVDVALSQNTRKRFQTLSGRFPRELTLLKRSLQRGSRKPIPIRFSN